MCVCYMDLRWDLKMPSIIDGSVRIMSGAGSGVAMFCMGENFRVFRRVNLDH